MPLPEPAAALFVPFPDDQGNSAYVTQDIQPTLQVAGRTIPIVFELSGTGDIRTVYGSEAIHAEIQQVLGTHAASETTRGELAWDPEFGSLVNMLRHQLDRPGFKSLARTLIADAVERYVTSIFVTGIGMDVEDTEYGKMLKITIYYQVRASGADDSTEAIV